MPTTTPPSQTTRPLATTPRQPYPIGTAGQSWGEAERLQWRARQVRQRLYADDVASRVERLRDRFDLLTYGELAYGDLHYALLAIRSRAWRDDRPSLLVTGGVHGYETSGVLGALQFVEEQGQASAEQVNWLVVPCVSPWAYEHVQRWNFDTVDPNRSFREASPALECAALMRLVAPLRGRWTAHIDLHETTNSDETEFRPAVAARDGKVFEPGTIPDGFYLVDDAANPQPAFQQAIIDAVARVTHIAPADTRGTIIGCPIAAPGIIRLSLQTRGLCANASLARYTTTTEVYPDSPRATPEQCAAAQVAAVRAALAHVSN